ncbi:MAG: hypothetical protein MIO93_00920 [ANME-2 cluster archaeon]|nr:hypothetical protein [ANME-2 cluster archaeon]
MNSYTHTRRISTTHPSIHPHFAPKARRKNRKAPDSPHTTRAGGADRDRHPGRVKARRGGRSAEDGMGAGFHSFLNADLR